MAELSIFFDLMGSSISSLNNFTSTSRTYDNDGKTLSFVIQGAASAVDAANAFTSGIDSYDSAYKRMLGKLGGGLGLGVVAVKIYEDKDLNWGDYFTIGASVVSLIGRFTPVGMILNIGSAAYTLYDLAENGWLENDLHPSLDQAERTSSPIVIDLNGDGIHATKLAGGLDKAVHFDLDGNGFAEKTAWIDASDALLVLDKNANGRIDNGHELFGNHSLNAEGKKAFADGYAALAAYDENQDGRIDAQDAVYAQLAVWQDKNGNGISEAGEVLGLAEAGIAAIDLNAKAVNERDAAGNRISHRGSVAMAEFDKSTSYGAANAVYWKSQTVRDLDSHTAQAIYATKAEYIVLALEERIKADGSVKTDLTYDEYAGASRQANEDHEFKGIKTIHDTPHEINAAPHVKVMTF